jgi:hypothetical protein
MISRFNLDQKRLKFYDDIELFHKEFDLIKSITNKEELNYIAKRPTVLINKNKTLKLSFIKNNNEFIYILFASHSLSILPDENIKVYKATKENTTFDLFSLKE